MGLYIYSWGKDRKCILLVIKLGAKPFENYGRPLKLKIMFLKGCLVYGICQKRIANAKRIQQKLN